MKKQQNEEEAGAAGTRAEEKKRKERRDKGRSLETPRDAVALRWLGEMYGVRLDQLQRLLGRMAQRETKEPGQVGLGTAERVVERWQRAGVVERRKYRFGEPAWVWLTRSGLRQLDLNFKYWEPPPNMQHYYWLNQVRLYLEGRRADIVWQPERGLKADMRGRVKLSGRTMHTVDAEVHTGKTVVAIEVELTAKKLVTTTAIVQALANGYPAILYFVSPKTRPTVERAVAALAPVQGKKFRIDDLTVTDEQPPRH